MKSSQLFHDMKIETNACIYFGGGGVLFSCFGRLAMCRERNKILGDLF